ncbi:TIGR00730 family Rossman fold protein [Silvibacterium dinghuense]|uniref:Cytokinin riboside 5'-monophosphate phosphoribohydrolase n=1 Tax=Silvibacterium dinghuense TaxID=1560006 RepID=A0A4V1NUS7_9BACT|nr:TIGR00730 family Rossman fold protein [Silvibacterium dinghuense]RXS93278.1 TIGR00730 family Rossman fold protein [Silvibacterium dinghuense]GGH04512.1 cytokinin riboside 5'-monophosphate phosphoribohydrolase [Silvibacterium dinghuense]
MNLPRHNIAVFCGSASGSRPAYLEAARALGRGIATRGHGLVYGGATVGLMGAVAEAALADGAPVIGVIPDVLAGREIAHRHLTELHAVGTMHERKALMAERSHAFLALPGGYGTLDEFFEIVTWAVLKIHASPCVLINIDGYWDPMLAFLDHVLAEGFLKPETRALVQLAGSVNEALDRVEQHWAAHPHAGLIGDPSVI